MTKDNLNILYLGYSGFPYGLAELQRILLISKALVYEGANVKVIGSRGLHNRVLHPDLKKIGHSQGIIYIYSSGTPFRSSSFFKRNMIKPFEKMLEFIVLYQLNKRDKIDAAIISTMNFGHLLFYKILSIFLGFKIILNFVELNSSIVTRKGIKFKINDYCFDHFAVKIADGVLPISEYLIKIIKKADNRKLYLKIPVVVDVDRYRGIYKSNSDKYFLFCGAAAYKELIFFIIGSFELIKGDNTSLYLVINGNNVQLSEIGSRITSSSKGRLIRVFNNVLDNELSVLYKNALGMLIPMRPTVQDQARFPHKIGEYLASGNPLVTTNYGEIKHYLKNKVNALIAEHFDEKEFSDKMKFVIDNPSECISIGNNGKMIALKYFDYKKYGKKIIEFIMELKTKNTLP